MIRTLALAALLAAAPLAAQPAQPRDLAAQAKAMADIGFLSGEWFGQGERNLPTGQTMRDSYVVRVTPKAGGLVAIVEGMTLRQNVEAAKPTPGSFAVISYDDRAKRYLFRSFGFGEMIEAAGELVAPGVFRWTVPAGPVLLRFTVDGTQGTWRETGERSADGGKTWSPTNTQVAYRTGVRSAAPPP